jgi:hypothetical protein
MLCIQEQVQRFPGEQAIHSAFLTKNLNPYPVEYSSAGPVFNSAVIIEVCNVPLRHPPLQGTALVFR